MHAPVPDKAEWKHMRRFLKAITGTCLEKDGYLGGWHTPEGLAGLAEPLCAVLICSTLSSCVKGHTTQTYRQEP